MSDFFGVKFSNLATKQKGLFGEKSGPLSPRYEEKKFEVTILTNELYHVAKL
jgi:hypothetical protein